ncbi:NAD(P)-dependent oxidoreductase [Streptomyces nitrosporeus]|uniref:NAD-dependent epimerase/dehydratase family protein n=1 Tax=Streptomyces nitrosporeus TaxID=28894 RepID=A0A5J6FDD4_9ACTN|nr:NAD(P)H-binding protein [Streptomyces nitrosporeus]QEU73504.1 NAD-dependent epimerase/dehydratase family protein [Streptomyces nitrosporeus]GGZ04101.1 3-beta hydroxysteroid dehydrogenase [Streptomyces nitrosporeus]
MSKKIAFFGATGTFGSRILTEALNRGYEVTAVVVGSAGELTVSHPNLTVTSGDVLNAKSVAEVAEGKDAVVSAVGGGYTDGKAHAAFVRNAAESLVEGLRLLGAGAPRFISIGGAGSLNTPDGKKVWDTPGLPELVTQVMRGQGDALDYLRTVSDVKWTHFSPAAQIEPGERTGNYRLGLDDLVIGEDGNSRISAEDYAVAFVDELDTPKHIQKRFTVGY